MKYIALALGFVLTSCGERKQLDPPALPPPPTANNYIRNIKVKYVKDELELSKYSSEFDARQKNRVVNIRVAANILDGTTIAPHEEFSFNDVIGERTKERGFKEATIIYMHVKQQGMGGGICQVSSTLYAAAMYGGLEVTQRTSHSRPVAYIDRGLDSTVSFPNIDLRIVNIFNQPIMIRAGLNITLNKGILTIAIVGVKNAYKEIDYEFKINHIIPFEQKYIRHKFIHKDRLVQHGRLGYPGVGIWKYIHFNETKTIKKVASKYKAVPEVWYTNGEENATERSTRELVHN